MPSRNHEHGPLSQPHGKPHVELSKPIPERFDSLTSGAEQGLTTILDMFEAFTGPGTSASTRTKNCQLHFQLKIPATHTFAVSYVTHHGYAQLDPGVNATFTTTAYFSNDASKYSTAKTTIVGDSNWATGLVYTKTDTMPVTSLVYAPCGESPILNLNLRVALASTNASAWGVVEDNDSYNYIIFGLQWSRCP